MADTSEDLLDPAETEALLRAAFGRRNDAFDSYRGDSGRRNRFEREATGLSGLISPEFELSSRLAEARPYELASFDAPPEVEAARATVAEPAAELELRIEFGRAELSADEVSCLREGAVVPLDALAGDPVDIVVDGRLIARGEVLVLDEKLCVRISEVLGTARVAGLSQEAVGS